MNANGQEMLQFIEQYESREAEKKEAAEGQKEIMAEAKSRGYDTAILRKIITIRKRDRADVDEEQAMIDLYLAAIGDA